MMKNEKELAARGCLCVEPSSPECTQHRQLTRAGAFCARGSAKYYVAGQLPKLGCDDAFAQHHIIDYSAKYIADQAYVPGRLGVRVRHVR